MDHFYESIGGWAAFTDLYRRVVREAPQRAKFVEIGSWLGRSAAFMGVEIVNSGKDIRLHCVDPWTDGGPDLRNTSYYKDLREPPFELFTKNTAPVAHVIIPHRMTSIEAAKGFADGSVDFLMIDGDHNYEAVRDDIAAWLPKMAPGSVISGDDYLWPGVKRAVTEKFGDRVVPVVKKERENYLNSVAYWSVQL